MLRFTLSRSDPPRGGIDWINEHEGLSGADPQIPTLHDHVAELHRARLSSLVLVSIDRTRALRARWSVVNRLDGNGCG